MSSRKIKQLFLRKTREMEQENKPQSTEGSHQSEPFSISGRTIYTKITVLKKIYLSERQLPSGILVTILKQYRMAFKHLQWGCLFLLVVFHPFIISPIFSVIFFFLMLLISMIIWAWYPHLAQSSNYLQAEDFWNQEK